jgi:hypothetical protein
MEQNHCSDASTCYSAVMDYLRKRNHDAFIANGVLLWMLLLTFLGLWLMVFRLYLVKPLRQPVDEDELPSADLDDNA